MSRSSLRAERGKTPTLVLPLLRGRVGWGLDCRVALLLAITSLAFVSPFNANAEFIEAPAYPAGQWQVNDTVSYLHSDEDDFANSVEITYGVNDWLAIAGAFNASGGENSNNDVLSGGDFTLQFDVLKETDYLPGTALRVTYSLTADDNEPDTVSSMAVFEKKIGRIDNFLNVAVGKTLGSHEEGGIEYGLAAQTMYGLNDYTENDEWSAGMEYFGDYGSTGQLQGFPGKGQEVGPIIAWQPLKNLQTSLNYLVGLDHNAPRSTVTFEINLTF